MIENKDLMIADANMGPRRLSFDDIVRSTFMVCVSDGGSGTCFACRVDAMRIAFITAKHVFPDAEDESEVCFDLDCYTANSFTCHRNSEGVHFSGVLLCGGRLSGVQFDSDICAVIVEDPAFPCVIRLCDLAARDLVALGDEVFLLGFPFIFDYPFCFETMLVGEERYPKAMLRHGYVASANLVINGV